MSPKSNAGSDRTLVSALLCLTVVTGLVDAVSYLGLSHVFTANMTGNVAFLGFAAAGVEGLSLARSGAALLAYLGGAALGGRVITWMRSGPRSRWSGVGIGVEAAFLAAAAALSLTWRVRAPPEAVRLLTVIALTAVAMGARNATVRKLGVPGLVTTVLTLTLAGLAADSRLAGGKGDHQVRQVASVVTMIAGALVGALLLRSFSVGTVLAAAALLSALCSLALSRTRETSS